MAETKLEEARERLARDLELQDGGGMAYTCHDGLYTVVVQGEDLRLILAELDRRSPPTREGEWVLVPREPTPEMRRAALDVWGELLSKRIPVFVAMPHVLKAALAAAPPPPDVSRGLDREALIRLIASFPAHQRDLGPDNTVFADHIPEDGAALGECPRPIERLADAIIAISAPAGGGMDSPLRSASPGSVLGSGGKPPLDEPERAAGAWELCREIARLEHSQDEDTTRTEPSEDDFDVLNRIIGKARMLCWPAPADTGRGE